MSKHIPFVFLPACLSNATGHGIRHILSIVSVFMISCSFGLTGLSNKEIAREHGLSEVTIKHHLKSLRSKLGARNRTHAVCRAIELGIAEEGVQPL
jgi:hypothetical protein